MYNNNNNNFASSALSPGVPQKNEDRTTTRYTNPINLQEIPRVILMEDTLHHILEPMEGGGPSTAPTNYPVDQSTGNSNAAAASAMEALIDESSFLTSPTTVATTIVPKNNHQFLMQSTATTDTTTGTTNNPNLKRSTEDVFWGTGSNVWDGFPMAAATTSTSTAATTNICSNCASHNNSSWTTTMMAAAAAPPLPDISPRSYVGVPCLHQSSATVTTDKKRHKMAHPVTMMMTKKSSGSSSDHGSNNYYSNNYINNYNNNNHHDQQSDETHLNDNIEGTEEDYVDKEGPRFRSYQAEQWSEMFEELLQYKKDYGHCCVPHSWKINGGLAGWVKRQRYQYKLWLDGEPRSTMTQERIDALERAGFVWDRHCAAWELRFQELHAFKRQFGHCNVPSKYGPNPQLSSWLKCQRRQYKSTCRLLNNTQRRAQNCKDGGLHKANDRLKTCLPLERIQRLEAIGFEWELRMARQPQVDAATSSSSNNSSNSSSTSSTNNNNSNNNSSSSSSCNGGVVQKTNSNGLVVMDYADQKDPER